MWCPPSPHGVPYWLLCDVLPYGYLRRDGDFDMRFYAVGRSASRMCHYTAKEIFRKKRESEISEISYFFQESFFFQKNEILDLMGWVSYYKWRFGVIKERKKYVILVR